MRASRNLALRHRFAFQALRGCVVLGSQLPMRLLGGLGALAGLAALAIASRYRRDAQTHLAVAFPDLSAKQRQVLLRGMARHLGRLLGEVSWLWRATEQQVEDRVSVNGLEYLQDALRLGRGAVIVTGHCGSWELLNARLAVAGIPLTIATRRVNHPAADLTLDRLRSRFGTKVVPRDRLAGQRLARALLHNRVVGLLIDQDISHLQGLFVPFFGRPAWTPSGAAELALRVGCPLLPVLTYRRPDRNHHVEVLPALVLRETTESNDPVRRLTAAATAAIESWIRAYPEQWVWFHKRWKTRPALPEPQPPDTSGP